MSTIVGRQPELAILKEMFDSHAAELLAVYGRRRIGKTFLIKSFFSNQDCIFLHATGLKDGSQAAQLEIFIDAVNETFNTLHPKPATWMQAFKLLTKTIVEQKFQQKIVIFLDELPWMVTPRFALIASIRSLLEH